MRSLFRGTQLKNANDTRNRALSCPISCRLRYSIILANDFETLSITLSVLLKPDRKNYSSTQQ